MSDDLTQKEILIRLMNSTEALQEKTTRVVSSVEGIEEHLRILNGKVATHSTNIKELQYFRIKATAYATAIATVVSLALNKLV